MKRMLGKAAQWWNGITSSRNQGAARKRTRPTLEVLEDRLAPATLGGAITPTLVLSHSGQAAATSTTAGFVPSQVRAYYGVSGIAFGSTVGDGAGQTIAIVDAYNDPNILGDLDTFDGAQAVNAGSGTTLFQQYGAASSFLTVYNQSGQVINPTSTSVPVDPAAAAGSSNNWEVEESLDVEWAHALAPGARIALVEANSNSGNDLYAGVGAARGLAGVSVVSLSWGGGEYSGETSSDSTFTTPSGHQGVTFVASTGDAGSPGGYPAYSANVVAVGGTVFSVNGTTGAIQGETAWSGSGGGTSLYEKEPAYQQGFQSTGFRTIPDVAFDAGSGVAIYDSFHAAGWEGVGGTSLSAPSWAGLIAIANQGRTLQGLQTLNSGGNAQQTLTALYSLPASDFHDITSGSNGGFSAGAGYDEVTGRGTPLANLLVPALASYGSTTPATDHLVVTTQPPASVTAGTGFSLVVSVETASGSVDTTFHGTVTLSLAANPGGSTLSGTLTVTAVNGVATFTGLSLNNAGTGYVIQAASSGLSSVTTSAFNVVTAQLAAPTLLSPLGNTSSTRPTFTWTAVSGATSYAIYLYDLTAGSVTVSTTVSGTTFTPATSLMVGHSYAWFVRSIAANGTSSPWSSQANFTVISFTQIVPVLIGPGGTITTTHPTFTWNPVAGAADYYLYLVDATTGRVAAAGYVVGTAATLSGSLTAGHTYEWWLLAVASNGSTSQWSNPLVFTVSGNATAVTAAALPDGSLLESLLDRLRRGG